MKKADIFILLFKARSAVTKVILPVNFYTHTYAFSLAFAWFFNRVNLLLISSYLFIYLYYAEDQAGVKSVPASKFITENYRTNNALLSTVGAR